MPYRHERGQPEPGPSRADGSGAGRDRL